MFFDLIRFFTMLFIKLNEYCVHVQCPWWSKLLILMSLLLKHLLNDWQSIKYIKHSQVLWSEMSNNVLIQFHFNTNKCLNCVSKAIQNIYLMETDSYRDHKFFFFGIFVFIMSTALSVPWIGKSNIKYEISHEKRKFNGFSWRIEIASALN